MFSFKSGSQKQERFDTFKLCVGLEIHKKKYNENETGKEKTFCSMVEFIPLFSIILLFLEIKFSIGLLTSC